MSDYELLMIVFTVIGIVIATLKSNGRLAVIFAFNLLGTAACCSTLFYHKYPRGLHLHFADKVEMNRQAMVQ